MRTSVFFSDEFRDILSEHIAGFKSQKSKSVYSASVSDLCDYLEKDFLDVTAEDIKAYFEHISDKKENTRSFIFHALRSVAITADERRGTSLKKSFFLPSPPVAKIYVDPGDVPPLEDIDRLLVYLKDSGQRQLFVILTLMLETGLSVQELITLERKNFAIDPEGRVFIVFEAKDEYAIPRNVEIRSETAMLVESFGRERPADAVGDSLFLNSKKAPLSLRVFERQLKKACEDAGTGPVRLREVKNVARAAMMKGGASANDLSYQTGLTGAWFFRLNRVVREDIPKASRYSVLKVSLNGEGKKN